MSVTLAVNFKTSVQRMLEIVKE